MQVEPCSAWRRSCAYRLHCPIYATVPPFPFVPLLDEYVMDMKLSDSPIEWMEDLPPEAQQRREVFARFGLASYYAQCVEKQLGILLASTFNPKFLDASPEERDQFYMHDLKKTMGQMLKAIRGRIAVSKELDEHLSKALDIRNWLAHEYFLKRDRQLLVWPGREKMVSELQSAADFLKKTDEELTDISLRWLEVGGITREQVDRELKAYIRDGNSPESKPGRS